MSITYPLLLQSITPSGPFYIVPSNQQAKVQMTMFLYVLSLPITSQWGEVTRIGYEWVAKSTMDLNVLSISEEKQVNQYIVIEGHPYNGINILLHDSMISHNFAYSR